MRPVVAMLRFGRSPRNLKFVLAIAGFSFLALRRQQFLILSSPFQGNEYGKQQDRKQQKPFTTGATTKRIRRAAAGSEEVAACVTVRDDEAYLDEWVDYHSRVLGFAQMMVYDTAERFEMRQWGDEKNEKQKLPANVTVIHVPHNEFSNSLALNEYIHKNCTELLRELGYAWFGLFPGVDQFLVSRQNTSINQLADRSCVDGLRCNELRFGGYLFGTSGKQVYSPQPVTKRFQFRDKRTLENVPAATAHDPSVPMASLFRLKPRLNATILHVETDVAVVHHYTRSVKEYARQKTDIFDKNYDPSPYQQSLQVGGVSDTTAWIALTREVPAYRLYDYDQVAATTARLRATKSNQRAVVCTVVKNEEAYIDEWIDYHHALGFFHFFVYDNSRHFEMEEWGLAKGEHVTVRHFPQEAPQAEAYQDCAIQAAEQYTWLAFFDVDEILILRKHGNIIGFLSQHLRHRGSLSINWLVYGVGYREVYAPLPFTKRCQYHSNSVTGHVKSIVRAEDMNTLRPAHPHFPYLKSGRLQKDTSGRQLGSGALCAFNNFHRPSDVALFFHYSSKSFKEFIAKRRRGRGTTVDESVAQLIAQAKARNVTVGKNVSTEAWEAMKRYNPNYALFDEFG